MKIHLGLGSNEGDRRLNLSRACEKIAQLANVCRLRISPVYETPALLPDLSPPEWNRPFLNLVIECETDLQPLDLLQQVKKIELALERKSSGRWSPRTMDIDLLFSDSLEMQSEALTLPHPRLYERAFVLDPLKDLNANFIPSAKRHIQHAPLWMGVVNVTPDSFSQKEGWFGFAEFEKTLDLWDEGFVQVLDVGAESTRPGATALAADAEWERLQPVLSRLKQRYQNTLLKPLISVDTRHVQTAEKALQLGVDILNDVSGLADEGFLDLIRGNDTQYVLMHSLSVPADRNQVLGEKIDAVTEIYHWFEKKLNRLEQKGIRKEQIWIDPGIGFGKTASQSLDLLKGMAKFNQLPYRLLVGHSRKSFFNSFVTRAPVDRDLETIGLSLNLAAKGVDMLRVHDPVAHTRAFQAWNHAN